MGNVITLTIESSGPVQYEVLQRDRLVDDSLQCLDQRPQTLTGIPHFESRNYRGKPIAGRLAKGVSGKRQIFGLWGIGNLWLTSATAIEIPVSHREATTRQYYDWS